MTNEQKRKDLLQKLKELDSQYVHDPLFAELNKILLKKRDAIIKKLNQLDRNTK